MSDFDNKMKTELQGYVKKNIHFNADDRERIHSKIQKKRSNFLYYGAFTITVFIAIVLIIPIWQDNGTILSITPSGFSDKQTEMKNMIDESFKDEQQDEEQIEETPVEDSIEQAEEKENPVENEQHEDINEESAVETIEPEEDEAEEKVEEEQEKQEEQANEEIELTEAEAWEIAGKLRAMSPTLVSLTDKEYLHPVAIGFELVGFETVDQVYELFTDFMIKDVIKQLYNSSLTTYENKVYLIPMDSFLTIETDYDIQITKLDDERYKISQDLITDLPVKFYVEIVVTKIDGVWKIIDYDSEGF